MQNQTLFRHQAVISQQQKIAGNILLKPRLPVMTITLLLCGWLVAVVSWLLSGRYTYTQTVGGWLEPTNGITQVYGPSSGGIVTQVLVAENDRVTKGTALLKLSRDTIFNNGKSINDALIQEVSNQIKRLQSQYSLTQQGHAAQQKRLQKAARRLSADRDKIIAMRQLRKDKMALLDKQRRAANKLVSQGYYSKQQLQSLEAQLLEETYQYQLLEREWLTVLQAIEDNEYQQQEEENNQQLRLLNLENQISELQKNLDQQHSQHEVVITAPADGQITHLHANVGHAAHANIPLLTLMPFDSDVTAHLLIPVSAAGQIATGQSINLRYDAFPYTQFGTFEAIIDSVSAHLMLPQEAAQSPLAMNVPVYLATATLLNHDIELYKQRIALRAGMTFEAEIAIRERHLFQWLFEPLYELNGGLL